MMIVMMLFEAFFLWSKVFWYNWKEDQSFCKLYQNFDEYCNSQSFLMHSFFLKTFWRPECLLVFFQSFEKDQSSQRVWATFMFFFSTLLQGPGFLVFSEKSLIGFTVFRIFWCVCNFFLKVLKRNRSYRKFLFKALTKTVGKYQLR